MTYNLFAFLLLALVALLVGLALDQKMGFWIPPRLLALAIGLRVLGSTARYEVIQRFYRGVGDAVAYYYDGLQRSGYLDTPGQAIFSLDFWQPQSGPWWGTHFLTTLSTLVVSLIGPTMRGEFLFFALFSLAGLLLIATAFRNVQRGPQALLYATWILCWPSLWFWPASVGKEAVLLLGIGLLVYGYAGDGAHVRWIPMLAGLGLSFAIRPHVAAVLAVATVTAHWLGTWTKFTPRRIFESLLALAIALAALQGMATQFGFDITDAEGVQEFVEFRAANTQKGGSQIAAVSTSPTGIPIAFVNIWMRPFPWDIHNATALVAAIEVLAFWGLIWIRRRPVLLALRRWRRHRLLRLALPLLAAYTLMIGLTFSNLGIIARQRTPVFPFMFMVVLAAPASAAVAVQRTSRASPPVSQRTSPVA